MLDEEQFRNVVAECAPELTLTSARAFAEGWDFELWEANGELLFRFPKRPECAEALVIEAKLLRELAPALKTPIPQPVHVTDGVDAFPLPFFSYRRLPGEPLRTVPERGDVAAQTGAFLYELHRFPAQRATELGVQAFTAQSWRDDYAAFRERTASEVTSLLAPDEQQAVAKFWDGFLNDDGNFQFTPVLIHADLGLEHLLVNDDRSRLLGAQRRPGGTQ
ncbi:MAG: phosphotransferase [Planctomycetes bacterium]|nr:phosphotransferase [Planctomycetota bacterium]